MFLPNYKVEFLLPLTLTVPQVAGQLLAIKWVKALPLKGTVTVLYLVAATFAILLPFIVGNVSQSSQTTALCLSIAIMIYFGFFMAIVNSAITGFVSIFHERETKLMSSFLLGCSLNAIVVLLLQIIIILSYPSGSSSTPHDLYQ